MTVSYQYDVASSSTGGFFRLLWRWRGSIWKLLYKELLLFISLYISIALSYDYLMSEYYKRIYEKIVIFCSGFVEIIPLSFILGFYVSFTATRWWQQYMAIPWPDKLMNIIALYVPGSDETSRILRRTLMRYLNLTLVLVLRSISIPVKRRFPTKDHLIEAGFMTKPELEMYSSVPSHEFNTFWIPCTWFVNLLREAKSECRITDSGGLKLIMEEFNDFRSKCGLLWSYDWVSIPLVYTQVVTLSTQAFFLASLLGRQHIHPPDDKLLSHQYGEYYFPIFTLLQFILYMGLLKLGEQLINPFGDDDEDFELNWIIDRHVKVSFLGVDILNSDPPPLMKDQYFDEMDIKLPYTEAAVAHKVKTYRGSVAAYNVPTDKQGLIIPEFADEQNDGSDEDNSTVQSSQHMAHKSSVWNVFSRKPKLTESQSIASFDSETMVETGLNPLWQGSDVSVEVDKQTANLKTGPQTTGFGSSQGIRGKIEEQKNKEFVVSIPERIVGGITDREKDESPTLSATDVSLTPRQSRDLGQTSFRKDSGTSKASISVPSAYPREQRKSISMQPIVGEKIVDLISVQRSQSSAAHKKFIKLQQMPHKSSIFKGTKVIDPKLRIRPFKSRVTFSDDTKKGEKQEIEKLVYFIPKPDIDNSNTELSEILDIHPDRVKASLTQNPLYPTTHLMVEIASDAVAEKKAELVMRRQSLDPNLIIDSNTSQEEDKWLHHQSLPNIQEGQEGEDVILNEALIGQTSPGIIREVSVRRHTSDQTTKRRKTFCRQSESEGEPTEEEVIVAIIEDQQRLAPENSCVPIEEEKFKYDMPFKKKRKDNSQPKPRQSSTESDTASYHTANSFLMQISEDREDFPDLLNTSTSSIESYTSAIDDEKNNKNQTDILFDKSVPKIFFTEPTPSTSSLATENGSPDQKEREEKSKFFPIRHNKSETSLNFSTEDNT